MNSVSTCHRSRYSLVLVLLALLLSSAQQVEELRHWHDAGDGQTQCMLCQGPADVPIAVTTTGPVQPQSAVASPVYYAAVLRTVPASSVQARAPPSHS